MLKDKANLAHTKLIVNDVDVCVDFYKAVCGLDEVIRVEDKMNGRPMTEVILEPASDGAASLVIMKFLDRPKTSAEQAVLVFFTSDIAAFVQRVEAHGGKVTEAPNDRGSAIVAFFEDPDGNLVEVAQLRK